MFAKELMGEKYPLSSGKSLVNEFFFSLSLDMNRNIAQALVDSQNRTTGSEADIAKGRQMQK